MENERINLDKISELEWEKYGKMRKVAQRRKIRAEHVFGGALIASAFVFLIWFMFHPIMAMNHVGLAANYTFNQFNASVHGSNTIVTMSLLHPGNLSNTTINRTITVLASNPKALSAFTVMVFLDVGIFALLIVAVMGLFLFIDLIIAVFQDQRELPYTYRTLQKFRFRIAERDANLKAFGFTPQEIAWYHAVRSELIKLEMDYVM